MAERKNPQLDAQHQAILRKMMLLPENKTCADCKGPSPRWASTNLGIFICITCSGIHRKLGTHISQVRSITLDTWTPSQIQHFKKFGNAKAAQYFEACLPPDFRRPNAADSMQMERFIRDKYENKRYITIENGGLGGQAAGRNRLSRLSKGPNPGALGPRPEQSAPPSHQPAYDSAPTVRKTGMSSMSYGGRFSRPVKPTREPPHAIATATSFASSTSNINPLQRANTLKQLLAMGFPQNVAVKAVGAGDGDLQRSLDWLLQQDGQSLKPAPNTTPSRPIQKDLLDFGEPLPPSTAASKTAQKRPVPKVLATESLISSTAKDSSAASQAIQTTSNGFADFANFGDFQRALPTATPAKEQDSSSTVSTATNPKSAAFSSSLADLYKKSTPTPTTMHSNFLPSSKPKSPLQFPNSSQTVGKAGTMSAHANDDSLGLTTFESLSPQNLRLSGKTVPTMRLSEQKQPTRVQPSQTFPSTNEPPPPPPPEHMLFPDTRENQPPPHSPKLESTASKTPCLQNTAGNTGERQEEQGTNLGSNVEPKEEPPKNDSKEKEEKQEDEEEEDPFAALSMMALSSATSAQKKRKDKKASSLPSTLEPSSSKGAQIVQGGINLDELLS